MNALTVCVNFHDYLAVTLPRNARLFNRVDPWNGDVSWREHLNDHPGIPGTQTDENPIYGDSYWKNWSAKYPAVPLDPKEIEGK